MISSKINLGHLCLHVENVKMLTKYPVFPEYNCLVLSPANLWQQNAQNFKKDSNLLSTIFHHHVIITNFWFFATLLIAIFFVSEPAKIQSINVRNAIWNATERLWCKAISDSNTTTNHSIRHYIGVDSKRSILYKIVARKTDQTLPAASGHPKFAITTKKFSHLHLLSERTECVRVPTNVPSLFSTFHLRILFRA